MRLIDADVLRREVHCAYSDDLGICEMIDNQPTAYDVKNIVEQLKENSKIYCEEYHQREGSLYIQDAIEIVRKGGG